jgi:hypothetical protein
VTTLWYSGTTDDEAIAKIIKESAADAIPKLGTVASLSLEKQTALFMPARSWIQAQLDDVAQLSPSSCTKDAVDVFNDGMARYRNLAQDFLDWREWGAAGLPMRFRCRSVSRRCSATPLPRSRRTARSRPEEPTLDAARRLQPGTEVLRTVRGRHRPSTWP